MPLRLPNAVALSLVLEGVMVLAACSGRDAGSHAPPSVQRTDSAGVEIVTTETRAQDVPVFATLDSAPDLRIGTLNGPEEEQFGSVADLAALPDGSVAVLDAQAAEIRVFGADGGYLRTVGDKGKGPGELTAPGSLELLTGDSLAVWDSGLSRVTVFAPDGSLGRIASVHPMGRAPITATSFFADGRMVSERPYGGSVPPEGKPTFLRYSALLELHAADGSLLDTVDILPSRELVMTITRTASAIFLAKSPARFARTDVFAATSDGLWAGFGDHWELRLYDPSNGRLKRILRAPGLDRPLSDAEARRVLKDALARDTTPGQRRFGQEVNDLSPRPALRPSYDRLVVDDQARLWVREWPGAGRDHHRWWVFGRDGALLGSVSVPERFRLMAVQGDQAWGVVRDELDVPYVVRYTLHTAGA